MKTTITVAYDEIENSEYRFVSTGMVTGLRFVTTLGDTENNDDYLNDTFGEYDD